MKIEWIELPAPLKPSALMNQEWCVTRPDGGMNYQFPVGLLVKTEDGTVYLVGDINQLSGTCDDCSMRDEIVAFSTSLVAEMKEATQGADQRGAWPDMTFPRRPVPGETP